MKIDKRALNIFQITKNIYIITFCKVIIFLCSLFFTYNFINLLKNILNTKHFEASYFIKFLLLTSFMLVSYYLALFFDNKQSHIIAKKVRNILRNNIFNKLEKLSLNYLEATSTSNLIVMNSSSIINIELYFHKFIPQVFATLFIVISSIIIFGFINIWLAVAMLLLYPLIPISIMIIIKKSKKANKKTFQDFLSLSDVFFDRINGMTVAKIYGKEQNIKDDIDSRSEKYRKSTMELLRHQLNSINAMDAITYISIFTMSLIAYFTTTNVFIIIFVVVASFECFRPLRALGGLFHISMKANIELENIYRLLDYPVPEKNSSVEIKDSQEITLNNVSFNYADKNVLRDINMKFQKNNISAIVGESGSGKSTIIKLIMGLIKANNGETLYGNLDLSTIPYNKISDIITLITSDSYISSGSIRNHLNINENLTEKDILDALEKVNLKDFILENGGLDFEVTPGATNLSGGQKQRLLAAKAILKDSYIYILDEAVSNIDDYSKKCVLEAFNSIKENKIIILISHDLSVLDICNNIYVLQNGDIVEHGSFEKLKTNNKLFETLLDEQLMLKEKFLGKEHNND